jgi:soluble lytic murein transglycosylase-like protein
MPALAVGALVVLVLLVLARRGNAAVASGDVNMRLVNVATAVSDEWGSVIDQASAIYGIPAIRILSHILVESDGDPGAIGQAGERGLLQLTQGALVDVNQNFPLAISWDDLLDPSKNIYAGTAFLSLQRRRVGGDLDLASEAYNAGAAAVQKNPNVDTAYLNKVLSTEQQLVAAGF